MKNKKKIVASIALIGALTFGGTWAFFQSSDSKTNIFTMGDNVKAEVVEKEWEETGKKLAENFYSSLVIPKDPKVVIESGTTDVYTAVKVEYFLTDDQGNETATTYAELAKFLDIDFASKKWVFEDNTKSVAIYTDKLSGSSATETVFDTITIKEAAVHPDSEEAKLPGAIVMKNFNIKVTGYVCQANIEGTSTAKAALQKAFPSLFE